MARKSKGTGRRAAGPAAGNPLAQSVMDSAQQIWLAGLGAFSRARSEGDKMFEMLVERGRTLRGQARSAADQAYKTARTQADAAAAQAAGKWDKLEQVFEDRVSRSLGRLGVLTSKDVEALAKQVAELNGSVRALMGATGAKKAPKARRSRAKKRS
jgi:poly(hydroxyalkanoate) granule-associated protein